MEGGRLDQRRLREKRPIRGIRGTRRPAKKENMARAVREGKSPPSNPGEGLTLSARKETNGEKDAKPCWVILADEKDNPGGTSSRRERRAKKRKRRQNEWYYCEEEERDRNKWLSCGALVGSGKTEGKTPDKRTDPQQHRKSNSNAGERQKKEGVLKQSNVRGEGARGGSNVKTTSDWSHTRSARKVLRPHSCSRWRPTTGGKNRPRLSSRTPRECREYSRRRENSREGSSQSQCRNGKGSGPDKGR